MDDPKSKLREQARARRANLRSPLHGDALLAHWPNSFATLSVAGYYPIGTEFDCLPLLQTLRGAGEDTGLPRMQGNDQPLLFHLWERGESLIRGDHGVSEPTADAPTFRPDVILVPLLAFDSVGARLGYGGGYYDRTLAAYPDARAVGIAFNEQEIACVPTEAHDQPLHAVLTPSGYRSFS